MSTHTQELAGIRERSETHAQRIVSMYDSELTHPRDIERQDTQERKDVRALLAIVDRQAGEIAELRAGWERWRELKADIRDAENGPDDRDEDK